MFLYEVEWKKLAVFAIWTMIMEVRNQRCAQVYRFFSQAQSLSWNFLCVHPLESNGASYLMTKMTQTSGHDLYVDSWGSAYVRQDFDTIESWNFLLGTAHEFSQKEWVEGLEETYN